MEQSSKSVLNDGNDKKTGNREKQIIHTSLAVIVANAGLSAVKFLIGTASHSPAVTSDAANNLGDALGSIVTVIGTWLSQRKADRKHPFGFGRVEYITSAVVAVMVIFVGVQSLIDSFRSILHPVLPSFSNAALWVLFLGLAVKFVLGLWLKRRGKKLHSSAILASGTDSMSDCILSAAALVSALLEKFCSIFIGNWLGLLISLLIIRSGFQVLMKPLDQLVGERTSTELTDEMKKTIESFPEVEGAYDLILNHYGEDSCIGSVHIQIPETMTAREIQGLSRKITHTVWKKYHVILTVGIYASNECDPVSVQIQKIVEETLQDFPEVHQMHGFYVDPEEKSVAFDLVFKFGTDGFAERKKIRKELQKKLPDHSIEIAVDGDYSD